MSTTLMRPSGHTTAAKDRTVQFKRRSALADALVIAVWTSAAIAVALFLAAKGPSQFGTLAAAVTSIGIVCGLVGSDLILVMLVLAARIPLIDQAVGHDRAMKLHRQLGKPGLYLLLGHGVILLIGYALAANANIFVEIASIWNLPDMPLAIIGLGLFITVVVTSLVAVRRRFPYEFWHVIHLISYAAVAFAIPHQFSEGGVLAGGFSRVYWIALYVVALGSILVFRFILPVVRSVEHDITVEEVEVVSPDVVSIHLRGRDLAALGSAGGQFFVWRFFTGKTWWHSHPISLSAQPTNDSARITVRALGDGSTELGLLPRGTRVWFEGPYGLFTDAARTSPKLAIVAAGIGVTPVRALLEHSRLAPGEATILLRASSEDQSYLWDEMEQLADERRAHFYTMIGRRPRGVETWLSASDHGRNVTLQSAFPDLQSSDLYVCGPQAWTDLVVRDARAAGLPEHQIHTERFDW
jgi:predicted ferric reductase